MRRLSEFEVYSARWSLKLSNVTNGARIDAARGEVVFHIPCAATADDLERLAAEVRAETAGKAGNCGKPEVPVTH